MIPMVEPSDELDAAYEAMVEAIDHWEIVGPMRVQGINGVFMVRSKIRLEDTPSVFAEEAQAANENAQFLHFRDMAHAAAFIQYQGMAAAIARVKEPQAT